MLQAMSKNLVTKCRQKMEQNTDISIGFSPKEVIKSLFPKNQIVEESGKGEKVTQKRHAGPKSRGA